MISNSFSNKLKASRSCKAFDDLKRHEGDTKYKDRDRTERERDKIVSYSFDNGRRHVSLPTIVIIPRTDRSENRLKSRVRLRDDFQMGRGSGTMCRRGSGSFRGRGIPRKLERGSDSHGKFQESLNKAPTTCDNIGSTKYYSECDRTKTKLVSTEDSRISKLLRRLCREDDVEKFYSVCKQLQEALMLPENGRYIRRSLDLIAESLLDILHSGPGPEAKHLAAACLGRVGYVLEQDFKRYMDWIFSKYSVERNDDVRMLLMKAVLETLRLESKAPKLKDFATALMGNLQSALENTDQADMLMVTVDVILALTKMYPATFAKYFRDTVDILVGWHIDCSQPEKVTLYASRCLQYLHTFWAKDIQFSITLLSQFVEDMEVFRDDLVHPLERASPTVMSFSPEDNVVRLTYLIRVFNSVIKGIGNFLSPTVSPSVQWNFINDCYTQLINTVVDADMIHPYADLFLAANECCCLLLAITQSRVLPSSELLFEYVYCQLRKSVFMEHAAQLSMLRLIRKAILEVSGNLPAHLISTLLGPESSLLKLRFSPSVIIQEEVIKVYRCLLNLKNIPLLQEAYKNVLGDMEVAYKQIVVSAEEICPGNPHMDTKYNEGDVKLVVLFHLKALADLANASNSIIGMWALKPSIMELLAVKLKPDSADLARFHPDLQYSLLYLLYSHCTRYNNFVSSSSLISDVKLRNTVCDILGLPSTFGPEVPTTSPTSGHLSVIMNLLSTLLEQELAVEVKMLVLKWTNELFLRALQHVAVLYEAREFKSLVHALTKTGQTTSSEIVLKVGNCIQLLLTAQDVKWEAKFLSTLYEFCTLHINSTHKAVRDKMALIMAMIPWQVTLSSCTQLPHNVRQKKNASDAAGFTREIITASKMQYLARLNTGEMQAQHFRRFMGYLLCGIHNKNEDWLKDVFCSCWPMRAPLTLDEDRSVYQFGQLALNSDSVLLLWATWEAAQLCVTFKLRTPLGKPQETFTTIEGAIKNLAREVSHNDDIFPHSRLGNLSKDTDLVYNLKDKKSLLEVGIWEQQRVRLLLEFVEHLEKSTYNASEGCATALLPPPKPVRTFFHTNKSTCAEWLTRIRMAVILVAIHSGQATAAVRHGYCLLQDYVDNSNTQSPEFERAVMYVSRALCRLRESEALHGIYAWCKEVSGKKFLWLKAAADHAAGKHETAAVSFQKLLNQDLSASPRGVTHSVPGDIGSPTRVGPKREPDHLVMSFMADQLTDCYLSVQNWKDLQQWKRMESEMWASQNGGLSSKFLLSQITESHVRALANFEDENYNVMCQLTEWEFLSKRNRCWSSYQLMGNARTVLHNIAMTVVADPKTSQAKAQRKLFTEKIYECLHVAQTHIEAGIRNNPSEFLNEALVLHYAASGLLSVLQKKPPYETFDLLEGYNSVRTLNTSVLTEVLWWSNFFNRTCASAKPRTEENSLVMPLYLQVAKTARKEGNLGLAQQLLEKYSDCKENFLTRFLSKNQFNLEDVANISSEIKQVFSVTNLVPKNVKVCTEIAKLFYSLEKAEAAVHMCALTVLNIPSHLYEDPAIGLKESSARLYLTMSKWLLQETRIIFDGINHIEGPLGTLLAEDRSIHDRTSSVFQIVDIPKSRLITQNGNQVIPAVDVVVGELLQYSVSRCPSLAKAWSQLAAWGYRWGRRVVDTASQTDDRLTDDDRAQINQCVPFGTSQPELESIYLIITQTRGVADEEDIEVEDFNTSEMIESKLQSVEALSGASREELATLVEIWQNVQKRVYSYYELSAYSYFKYLELWGHKQGADDSGDCTTITATLRLLRLIVKHALELQSVLEAGLTCTPTHPWKGIIPQLFSRLSHPEPYVRRRLSELLCRVAEDAPHLITFPAVVGAAEGGARLGDMRINSSSSRLFGKCISESSSEGEERDDVDENDDDDEEEEEEEEDDDDYVSSDGAEVSVLNTCFLAMVDILSKQAPEAISQVQLLVKELRRITLLWDELWLGTLIQHQTDITRRLSQLELEVARVDDNPSLSPAEKDIIIAEKHRIILKPVVFILEQLQAVTNVTSETPHEKWFQEKFGRCISEGISRLKDPFNPRRPHESWLPLKQFQARLQQRAHKRASYTIRLADVSPALAGVKDTLIAMPGVASKAGKIITVAKINNNIAVLPTKTKPKKLVFHGSDGRMYTYLFKGLEDLHLDERIMQFLSIANTMLRKNNGGKQYYARHYSVIPLGPRSGLISWVDGVTPLFALYKRWQQREVAAASLKGHVSPNASQASTSGNIQVMRPSELFYTKLTPLLKEKGITNLDNRKEWPSSILKQVLIELMDETPKDLLAKELWCHSENSGVWWRNVCTYSCSVAVMSIIGYIIGLGDRHLDNVLVDLATGEVVHIDYNVCFEKGKTLRVPEKVPFRMTPNIRTALGVTGVEGIFRLTCEHVLKVLKKGRETLLTLLEAFVYDPLIDWTPGNEAGYAGAVYGGGQAILMESRQTRKEVEKEVTCSMFCVRVAEMKAEWFKNKDEILAAIPELMSCLNNWLTVQNRIKSAQDSLQDLHQQMALVKEAEASTQHPLYTLPGRYVQHHRAREALEKVRAALKDKIEECDKHIKLHKVALTIVKGTQLNKWVSEVNFIAEKENHLVFDLVKEFLQNAGQAQMILQCEHAEVDLGRLETQQILLVRSCLDLLSKYGTVASLYPACYINTHRTILYRHWSKHLLNNLTLESVREVLDQFHATTSNEVGSSQKQLVFSSVYQLQSAVNAAQNQLKKCYERMGSEEITDDAALRLEASYADGQAAIVNFQMAEKGATMAIECVTVQALCSVNKRYLMLEAGAASAGDCLLDLMSLDGDWFLDEMYFVTSLLNELAGLALDNYHAGFITSQVPGADSRVELALQCLQSANVIFKGLLELNFNFHTIILPEALKTLQMEEPSVVNMVQELDNILADIGVPVGDLLAQLQIHLRYIIMEMDSPHSDVQTLVGIIRTKFNDMLLHSDLQESESRPHVPTADDSLSSGQMLLMGFNGLFEKLHVDGNTLIEALETLDIDTPSCWKKVDQFQDATKLVAPIFNPATRGVLEDIFLLKRLKTMQDFFGLCKQAAGGSLLDDEQLNKPIRRFTADYVSRLLLGVTSQTVALTVCLLMQSVGLNVTVEVEQQDIGVECRVPIEELTRKTVDYCLKRGLFTAATLSHASGLIAALESVWRQREVCRHLHQEAEARRSSLQRWQLQLTAHYWLHEDVLALSGAANSNNTPLHRPSFMMDLRKTSAALLALQPRMNEAREQLSSLVASVEQRLKWAAGANPALIEVMAAFETAMNCRADQLNHQQKLASAVGNTCNAVLHHEALRTRTSEGLAHDTAYLQLLEQCKKGCELAASCDQAVTVSEENLIKLIKLDGPVDRKWIHNAEIVISNSIKAVQQQLVSLQTSSVAAQEGVKNQATIIRCLLSTHHKLMLEVRGLLKSMLKIDEFGSCGLQEFVNNYRLYSEEFSSLIRELMVDELDLDRVVRVLEQLKHLEQRTGPIYKDLLKFSKRQIYGLEPETQEKELRPKRPPLMRQDSVCFSPQKGVPVLPTSARDPHTGKAVQQRNAYALSVWRRVRMKLEGRDPDPGRRASVQEQVDFVVREAMSLDNLALLYEGWTPWV